MSLHLKRGLAVTVCGIFHVSFQDNQKHWIATSLHGDLHYTQTPCVIKPRNNVFLMCLFCFSLFINLETNSRFWLFWFMNVLMFLVNDLHCFLCNRFTVDAHYARSSLECITSYVFIWITYKHRLRLIPSHIYLNFQTRICLRLMFQFPMRSKLARQVQS